MQHILIYSDSLSWGIIPNSRNRLPFEKRWPGVLESSLNAKGNNVRIIENCLNGRRTTWDDPFKEGRDGSQGLAQAVEINSPLKLLILMLGTNDFQCIHEYNAWSSAQGIAKLINIIRQAPIEPGMLIPEIMVVAPPEIVAPKGVIAKKFKGSENRCISLASELKSVAEKFSVIYFDSNSVTGASQVDGIHLDEEQHQLLGKAIAQQLLTRIIHEG